MKFFEARRYAVTGTSTTGNTHVQVGAWKVFNKFDGAEESTFTSDGEAVMSLLRCLVLRVPGRPRPTPTTPRSTARSPRAPWSRTCSSIFDDLRQHGDGRCPGNPYDPSVAYPGGYDSRQGLLQKEKKLGRVHEQCRQYHLLQHQDQSGDQGRPPRNSKVKGSSPFSCDSSKSYMLRTGNYRNYLLENDPNSYRRRIDVAKDVLRDIVNNTDGVLRLDGVQLRAGRPPRGLLRLK